MDSFFKFIFETILRALPAHTGSLASLLSAKKKRHPLFFSVTRHPQSKVNKYRERVRSTLRAPPQKKQTDKLQQQQSEERAEGHHTALSIVFLSLSLCVCVCARSSTRERGEERIRQEKGSLVCCIFFLFSHPRFYFLFF
jgi:hypothetical protein